MQCNMPNGWPEEPEYDEVVQRSAPAFTGAHSDTATLTDKPIHADDRTRLRATCYFGDCPPGCGGFTVWPQSHDKIWSHTRTCRRDGRSYHPCACAAALF